jgi:hypothetical protein
MADSSGVRVEVDFSQLDGFKKKISRFVPRWLRYHEVTVKEVVGEFYEDVRQAASGRPGPNVVSGQYISAFQRSDTKVWNESPQGPRLEYGYTGVDSLNRHYHQPPFPHWRPAIQRTQKKFPRKVKQTIIQVWRESR